MFVFIVRSDPCEGARLSDRLVVPGKTYSLMLSRMLRARLGGRTAVEGRACGCDESSCASVAAAGSMVRDLRRIEELLCMVSDGGSLTW